MVQSAEYWKEKHLTLMLQNQQLKTQIAQIHKALQQTQQRNNNNQQKIKDLQAKISHLEAPLDHSTTFINSLCGPTQVIHRSFNRTSSFKRQVAKEYPGSIIQQNTRQSVVPQGADLMFQAFYVISISDPQIILLNPAAPLEPKFLFQFPQDSKFTQSEVCKKAFPNGVVPNFVDMEQSGSAFYSILYSNCRRDNGNSFVFTLDQPNRKRKRFPGMANAARQVVYGCCVTTYDVLQTETQVLMPCIPTVYCLMTYYPCFQAHFQVIYRVLQLKKAQRMSVFDSIQSSINFAELRSQSMDIERLQLGQQELGLLQEYLQNFFIEDGGHVSINLQSVSSIQCDLPPDLSFLDTEYFCCLAFSLLRFRDFFKILCAIANEAQIIFHSTNSDFVSSCVLGIVGLLRPFLWQYFLSPVLPESDQNLLDTKQPFVTGLVSTPNQRLRYKTVIWVHLDQPKLSRRLKLMGHQQSVPEGNDISSYLRIPYKRLRGPPCYQPSQDQIQAIRRIQQQLKKY